MKLLLKNTVMIRVYRRYAGICLVDAVISIDEEIETSVEVSIFLYC